MPRKDDCIRLIEEVESTANDPESAYALRARILRATVAVGQLVAKRVDVSPPLLPEDVNRIEAPDPGWGKVAEATREVLAQTRRLCQPSEALDARWRVGWEEFRPSLARLKERLNEVEP